MKDSGFPPVRLATVPRAFDHSDFIFELKYDGFRAVAHAEHSGNLRLISRNGDAFKIYPRLSSAIAEALAGRDAVLDGDNSAEKVSFSASGIPENEQIFAPVQKTAVQQRPELPANLGRQAFQIKVSQCFVFRKL